MQNCHPTVKTVASKTPILWELAFGLANKIQLGAPTSCIREPDSSLSSASNSSFLQIHAGKQQMMAQILGPPPSVWETWTEFQLQALVWPGPSCYGHLASEPEEREFLILSVPLSIFLLNK